MTSPDPHLPCQKALADLQRERDELMVWVEQLRELARAAAGGYGLLLDRCCATPENPRPSQTDPVIRHVKAVLAGEVKP